MRSKSITQRALVGLIAAAGAVVAAPPADAGNLDGYLLGNDAALTGGAVRAVIRDGEASWYNPAGLAGLDQTSVDVSASVFVLRYRPMHDAMVARLPAGDEKRDLTGLEILSVPSAVVFARELAPGLTLGAGVFVPISDAFSASDAYLAEDIAGDNNAVIDYEQRVELQSQITEYQGGAGLGWQVIPELRIGLTLFLSYTDIQSRHETFAHVWSPALPEALNVVLVEDSSERIRAIGGRAQFGLQWEPVESWHLGLVVETPLVLFHVWSESESLTALGAIAGVNRFVGGGFVDVTDKGLDGELVRPARIHLAFAKSFGDRTWLSLEADIQPPLKNPDVGIDSETTWNLRAGGRFQLFDGFWGGAGFFTDQASSPAPLELGDNRANWYGIALGAELRRTLLVYDTDAGERELVFSSTFALRYAAGLAEYGTGSYSPLDETDEVHHGVRRSVFHELGLHLGSALYF